MNLEEVDLYYHNAMKKFKAELDKTKTSYIRTLRVVFSTYDSALGQLGARFERIDTYTNNKQTNELAMLVLGTKRVVDAIEDNVQKLCNGSRIVRYGFVPDDPSLLRLLQAPFLVQTITLKHESDENKCSIKDIALLKENLILEIDFNNSSLKMFKTGTSTPISKVKLQFRPWQMSLTKQGEAYVSLNDQPKILHLMSPATDLNTFRQIDVSGKCYGVECLHKTLKVQCASPAKIIEVDIDGKQIGVINNDLSKETTENGEQFVTHPIWTTQDPATGSMYVSCDRKHSITEISSDCNVRLLVKSDKLKNPKGLCMDTDGSLLVCCDQSKEVLKVKRNGDILNILPQPLDFKPFAVAFDKRRKRLYVAGISDKLCVFQI